MKYDFPINYMKDNIVINDKGEVWAYFRIDGFNYEFANESEKFSFYNSQLVGLQNEIYDFHFLTIPNPTNIDDIIEKSIKSISFKEYPLKENGITLLKSVLKQLKEIQKNSESSEYYDYVGVQLNELKRVYPEGNAGLAFFRQSKEFFKSINSPIYQAVGLKKGDILESELEAYAATIRLLETNLTTMYSSKVKAVSFVELLQIVELNFSTRTNNSDIKLRNEFSLNAEIIGTNKDKKYRAFRPDKKHFLAIQDVNIEEINPTKLKISRINEDNKVEDVFVQHSLVYELPDVAYFPNNEWLYKLKMHMEFPVMVSIRASRIPNNQILKKLGNQKLEIDDQRLEAHKGNTQVDRNVEETDSATGELENYFTKTGYPAFDTSIVFRVTASNKELLDKRILALRDYLARYGIKINSPYGEQLSLFSEMIAGGKKINNDYSNLIAPTVLSGCMFGATTNIGDNRGFYIGQTTHSKKNVFIQPDLAAKNFEGMQTLVNSLAVLVAGMTGKGKSFFMNLLTYLAVLTMGAKALIIDPKGDRKDWANGLPLIDTNNVKVWSLGNDKKDEGALDPFRTSLTIEEGKNIAKDILAFLTQISLKDFSYSVLTDAVEHTALQPEPCLEVVVEYLVKRKEESKGSLSERLYEELEGFINTLESLRRDKISSLLFGKVGQEYNTLSHDVPLQVLMTENLTFPTEKEKEKNALRPVHFISEAILISITAWTKEYMIKNDKSVFKIILQDEANIIKQNPIGEQLLDTITRQGRSYNTSLLQGAQNASDHRDNVANIGMKFCFGLRKKEEAIEMLEFLNLPNTKENVDKIMKLPNGQALFQDIFGRSAIIQINPVFEEIYNAFDTSTSTKEEQEAEKEVAVY